MNNGINIVFITDTNFVIQTHLAIMSLVKYKNKDSFYNIYVIAKDITEEQYDNFKLLEIEDVKITIINGNEYISKVNKLDGQMPMIYWRLKLPEYFCNFNKILHLDCDIVVSKDITELYDTNIDNYYIAAVRDIAPTIYHASKNKIYSNYFNAGIMLLNLKNIRESNYFNIVLDETTKNGDKYFFKEQDILNNTIGNKLKIISSKFNFIASNRRYTNTQLKNFYGEIISDKDIAIIHYAGKCRPWIYKWTYFANIWNDLYKNSHYANTKLKLNPVPFLKLYVYLSSQIKIIQKTSLYKRIGIL